MTPQGVADRLRKVGTEGGVVMLVWHNKVDTRTFLKDDRKSPQGEEPAEKLTPPVEETKRGTREEGTPGARKRDREEATATRRQ